MAKRVINEKEIIDHLQKEGFREIKEAEKLIKWYKKTSERPSCLRAVQKKKIIGLLHMLRIMGLGLSY